MKAQATQKPSETKPAETSVQKAGSEKELLAVVRIRGGVNLRTNIQTTLESLRLYKKNTCVVMQNTPANAGMIRKVKDYVTYGEISAETLKALATKRKKQSISSAAYKVFTLHPPKGGFERKGIKKAFTKGGALGYRGSHINPLVKTMI